MPLCYVGCHAWDEPRRPLSRCKYYVTKAWTGDRGNSSSGAGAQHHKEEKPTPAREEK